MAKRRTKYRKHVTQDFNDAERVPEEGELYAKVGQSHGGNIFEIVTPEGNSTLARLPTKFRKLIWVKRGDFVIVSCAKEEYETATGAVGRVTHSIEHILNSDQVKKLKKTLDKTSIFFTEKDQNDGNFVNDDEQVKKSVDQLGNDVNNMKVAVTRSNEGNGASSNGKNDDNIILQQQNNNMEQYNNYFDDNDNDDDLFINRNRPVESDVEDDDSDSD
jgi:initiation factor 1A